MILYFLLDRYIKARCATAVALVCLVNLQQCKPASSAYEFPRPLVSFHNTPFLSVWTTPPGAFLLTDIRDLPTLVGHPPTSLGRGGGSAIAIVISPPPCRRCHFEEGTIEEMIDVKLVHTSISVCNLQSNCVCATTIHVDVLETPIPTVVWWIFGRSVPVSC